MSGKRNVSVCRGHELANALYKVVYDEYPSGHLFLIRFAQKLGGTLISLDGYYRLPVKHVVSVILAAEIN